MRILGLDIGTTSIKAVEVDTAFGRFEIHGYHEIKVNPSTSAVDAAGGFVRSLPRQPSKIVTSIRTNRLTYRNLKLPTRDKKAIASSVRFELEDDLPFEFDDCVSDYIVISSQGSETNVHAAASLKSTVGDYVGHLVKSGVDPDILTTESCAFRSLLKKMAPGILPDQAPFLVVQMGHERTLIYAQYKNAPLLCREIPWGGRNINHNLSKRYNLSIEAAEKTKMDHGFVLPQSQLQTVSNEQREFSESIRESLSELIHHIKQAELSLKNLTGLRTSTIFITGGTSQLPGVASIIAEETKVSTQFLKAMSSLGGSGVTFSESTEAKFALATGLALSAMSSEKPFLINFRKKDFAKKGTTHEFDISQLKAPLATASGFAAAAMIILGVELTLYDQKLKDVNSQLEKSIKTFFSGLSQSTIRTYLVNTGNLKRNIDGELNKERDLAKLMSANPSAPLEVLKALSAHIPKTVTTDLIQLQIGSSAQTSYTSADISNPRIQLSFIVDNQQMSDRLESLLTSKLKDLKKEKFEPYQSSEAATQYKVIFSGKWGG